MKHFQIDTEIKSNIINDYVAIVTEQLQQKQQNVYLSFSFLTSI